MPESRAIRIADWEGHREIQLAAGRNQRSGVKLISDLRLLTSVIYDFNGFNDLPFTASRLPFTVYCPLKRFVSIELLGKSVDRVDIVITSVIVEKYFLLLLGILGPSPTMRPEIKGDAGNGIWVIEKIDPAVAVAVPTIMFDIGG